MAAETQTIAHLTEVTPLRSETRVGVVLCFRPRSGRSGMQRIDDWADLGPEFGIPAIHGVGKVLRVLRAARIVAPKDPLELLGREERAAALLGRAVGTLLRVAVRRRSRLRFVAWTEQGIETVNNVAEVQEHDDAYLVMRRGGRFPVRFERHAVVRQRREFENWYEVLDIERA
jgi:hypothetical protein